ncbi:MAM and LDL-receptor class A domain-containing protein 1-like [Antedon mediterranea]|uniref:MAM and LDL-receptor class A domain-containing protein 1-like n=1 Tax=Antedon mediterranea TaxID=105859 RepID=UPI003AF7ABC3
MATHGACDASYLKLTTNHYLLVTNGTSYEVNSKVYKWNFTSNLFVEYAQLPSHGSLSGKLFSVDGIMYAAIASLNGTAAVPGVWKIKENVNTDFNNGFVEWTQENVDTSSMVQTNFQTGFDGWAQENNDDFDWTRMKGATGSTNTGPTNGHTGDYYVYIGPMSARLRSPLLSSGQQISLSFYYHMYGDTIGTLNVYRTSNLGDELLWTRSGNYGDSWRYSGTIPFTHNGYGDNYIVFEAIKGSSHTGDIAIDDIQYNGVQTDFQTGFDGWAQENNDEFDWTRMKGATGSTNTGPTDGHTGDYYVYIETTSHTIGMSARLRSPLLSSGQQISLSFYYHMYGDTIGTLNVYRTSNLGDELLWTRSGNYGDSWRYSGTIQFTHNGYGNNYIVFEAIKGSSHTGDIAIDDIQYNGVQTDFRTGFDGWAQENNDDFDWTRITGATGSSNTGPTNGHTGDYYVYIETSITEGESARLRSPLLPPGQRVSLLFYYHMYGPIIGTLNVYRTSNLGDELLWTRSGNQGDSWRNAVIQFEKTGDEDNYIVFEGIRGSDFTGDIAIDDIQYCCSNESDAFWPTGIETFTNDGDTYLVAVNPLECAHTIIVYRWDKMSEEFKIHQRIPVEHCPTRSTIFKVGGEVFMIITTSRTESRESDDDLELYTTSSPIFKLEGSMFVSYGAIPSHECYDIIFFERDGEYFLGQSNKRNVSGGITSPSFNIYQWV